MREPRHAPEDHKDAAQPHHLAHPGVQVIDASGNKIGTVIEHDAEQSYFVMRRGIFFPREIYVPFAAVAAVNDHMVQLRVSREMLLNLDWTSPPIAADLGEASSLDTASE